MDTTGLRTQNGHTRVRTMNCTSASQDTPQNRMFCGVSCVVQPAVALATLQPADVLDRKVPL
jgi:hypothetical protein